MENKVQYFKQALSAKTDEWKLFVNITKLLLFWKLLSDKQKFDEPLMILWSLLVIVISLSYSPSLMEQKQILFHKRKVFKRRI